MLKETEFVKKLSKDLAKSTSYHILDPADNLLNQVAYLTRANLNDDCLVSIEFNQNFTKIINVNFCLQDETGDGPAVYTNHGNDLLDLAILEVILARYIEF